MELSSVILVVSKDVGQMVRQTSVSTNSIREGMLRLLQGSIPCCPIFITLESHDAIVVWLFIMEVNGMAVMINSKYGYEPPEWVQVDARLDKWHKDKERCEKKRRKQYDKDKKMPLS